MSIIGGEHKNTANVQGKERRSWLTGNMAQAMVFLNGLILTFTAYATLNVFILQIVTESVDSVAVETQEHIGDRFSNLEKSIQTAASIVSFSGRLESPEIVSNFSETFSYGDYYDQIFWLEKLDGGQYSARKMISNPDSADYIAKESTALHEFVVQNIKRGTPEIQILNEYKGFVVQAGQNDYPLILARAVRRADGVEDIIYGLTRVGQVVAPTFFEDRQSITSLTIVFGSQNLGLFKYGRSNVDADGGKNVFRKEFQIPLAGKQMMIEERISSASVRIFLRTSRY